MSTNLLSVFRRILSKNVDTKIRIVETFFRYTYLNGQDKANLSGIFSMIKIPVETRKALF